MSRPRRGESEALEPVLVGARELPPRADAVIALLAPALLTALVVTETFGEDGHIVLDERAFQAIVGPEGPRPPSRRGTQ